jgi:hypothetical protein
MTVVFVISLRTLPRKMPVQKLKLDKVATLYHFKFIYFCEIEGTDVLTAFVFRIHVFWVVGRSSILIYSRRFDVNILASSSRGKDILLGLLLLRMTAIYSFKSRQPITLPLQRNDPGDFSYHSAVCVCRLGY